MFHREENKKIKFFKLLLVFLILFFGGSFFWSLVDSGQLKFYLQKDKNKQIIIKSEDNGEAAAGEENNSTFEQIDNSLTLAAIAMKDGIHLGWDSYQGGDFKFYKIVRSKNNPDLRYPEDGSIKYSGEQSMSNYIDTDVEKGVEYYYRICVKVESGAVKCGSVARSK